MNEKCRLRKDFDMNTKRGYLRITIALSIVPVIVGMLMLILCDSADEKTVGFAMAVIGPAVIWGVYGCAYLVFKGSLQK